MMKRHIRFVHVETRKGVCEHKFVTTREFDFFMGTFTKSFGAAGGYVALSPELINCVQVTYSG